MSSCIARAPPSPRLTELTCSARNFPSGLNAPFTAELPAGSVMAFRLPVTRSSTRTWQRGSQPVTQATWRAVAAMTALKERMAPAAAGSHSR